MLSWSWLSSAKFLKSLAVLRELKFLWVLWGIILTRISSSCEDKGNRQQTWSPLINSPLISPLRFLVQNSILGNSQKESQQKQNGDFKRILNLLQLKKSKCSRIIIWQKIWLNYVDCLSLGIFSLLISRRYSFSQFMNVLLPWQEESLISSVITFQIVFKYKTPL